VDEEKQKEKAQEERNYTGEEEQRAPEIIYFNKIVLCAFKSICFHYRAEIIPEARGGNGKVLFYWGSSYMRELNFISA
jgi:hypothetical protein